MGITLEKRKLPRGRVALYLNFCFGYKRWRESLHLTLDKPVDTASRRLNREKMKLALAIRSRRELEFACETHGLPSPRHDIRTDWFEVCHDFVGQYKGKDINMVTASCAYLRRFAGPGPLHAERIDRAFCLRFRAFLAEHLSGHTPVGYFAKFKQSLDYGVEQHLLPANPAAGIRQVKHNEFAKSILGEDELRRLAATPCHHREVKRAFLLSCLTGLRWCDVVKLRTDAVDRPNRMLHLVQHKVERHSSKAILHLALNDTALRLLLAFPPAADGRVFTLPSYSYARRVLHEWVCRAGITKHITFHCARHSFVTNLLANGANIKTASELAGHSTVRHTEKYVHVVDELKRKAVDSLPVLHVDF